MKNRIRTAIFAVALALMFAVTAISMPVLLASQKLSLNASVSIKFNTTAQQVTELTNTGLQCRVNDDGTLIMEKTSVSVLTGSTTKENIKKQHESLVKAGILRYAMYSGSLCAQAQGASQLLVILDFTNYNISKFESGYLSGLTYAILGSNERLGSGYKFTVTNKKGATVDDGLLTVYDSADGGRVITDDYTLTMQGIYESGQWLNFANSTVSINGGTADEITNYSIRIVLPGNQKVPVTLDSGSLTIDGASLGGINIGAPKQPDTIGLGISHLGISSDNHSSVIRIAQGAANCSHFHWMTVTETQMGFSFQRMLDNFSNASLPREYADEIFKKPHAYSDFAHLYISSRKDADGKPLINIFDSPVGEMVESTGGIASAIRVLYWYNFYIGYYNVENFDINFYHYRRSADNKIENNPGTLLYDKVAQSAVQGESQLCHAVYCGHAGEESHLIGYFSPNGNFYDENQNPILPE